MKNNPTTKQFKEITLPHLKNLYCRMSLRRKNDILQKCLGSGIWSALALEMNYKFVDKINKRRK